MTKRVLVVEDEELLARAVDRLLRRVGYDVDVKGTCHAALNAHGRFALGIFDLDLPDGDGIEISQMLTRVKTVERSLFFSGSSDPELRQRACELGAFIEKSRGVSALLMLVDETLSVRRERVSGAEDVVLAESSAPPPSGVRTQRR